MSLQHTGASTSLTLTGMILAGTFLGFYWQRMADSGQLQMSNIVLTCALTVASYLIALLVVETLKIRRGSLWVLATLIGSVLSAFNVQVAKFLIVNARDPFSPSFLEQLDRIAFGFVVCALFFSVISIATVAALHLLRRSFERFPSS